MIAEPKRVNLTAIAAFIGARLQHRAPPNNSCNPRVSTINVQQYKQKFDQIRIYCTLAETEQVRQAWAESSDWTESDSVPDEFRERCLIRDAEHYRKCYLDMIELVPGQRQALVSGADHPELLFDREQLDSWFDNAKPEVALLSCCQKWRVKSVVELRQLLYKICWFK